MKTVRKNIFNYFCKCIVSSIIMLCMVFNILSVTVMGDSSGANHEDKDKKIVRVGYYRDNEAFQTGYSDDERKSGYAYEYYQEIAKYTGWTYEYVYGSWEEVYEKLINGEVDIMSGVSKTDEYVSDMLFPDKSMGYETYYLFVPDDKEEQYKNNISNLDGARIGVKSNSYMKKLVEKFAQENNIDVEIISYDSLDERLENVAGGNLDSIATVENGDMKGFTQIYNLGSADFYFAVNKDRPDILNELNKAQNEILSNYSYYVSKLQDKYFNQNSVQTHLSDEEIEWLKSHTHLRVGYLEDYMPFCAKDKKNGELIGMLSEVLSLLSEYMGTDFDTVGYNSYNDMIQSMEKGDIDFVFPTFDDMWYSEQQNYIQTVPVASTLMSLIYNGNYRDDTYDRIAVSKGSPLQSFYLTTNYPDSEQVTYKNWKECLDAIESGEVGCMLVNGDLIYRYLNEHEEYSELFVAEVEDMVGFCFAIPRDNNILYSILNKGVNDIDDAFTNDSIIRNSYVEPRYTFEKFLKSHIMSVYIFALGFTAMLILFFLLYRRRVKREQSILKETYIREKEYIADKEKKFNIIGSLSRIYSCTYYINIAEKKYQLISDLDIENGDNNFVNIAAEDTDIWINSHIKEPYRKKMCDFFDLDTLQERMKLCDNISIEYETDDNGWNRGSFISVERDYDGKLMHVIFAIQEINEEKEAQEMTHTALTDAYEAANRANHAKSDFLARMSHDIRTPLNAIIGMTAIASSYINDASRMSDCLKKISASGKHLLTLINDVLDMSKIESGRMELAEEEFNLHELIENMLSIIQPQIDDKQHTLKVSGENVEHDNVIGDSLHIQQVCVNILGNAVKYTPSGGMIKFTVTEKSINKPNISCYEFIFEDNGIGMSPEFLQHIFEPFTRENETKDNYIQGTGLGLSIVYNIIQMMGGDIKVESIQGKGSKFTVTIYLRIQEGINVSFENEINLPVLVVDDNRKNCEDTGFILSELGIQSEWVLSGREAVDKIRSSKNEKGYYAIIIDWKMPEMNGIETAKAIYDILGYSIPIIIMSGYDWSEIETEARAIGLNYFISKPILKSRLINLLKRIINSDVSKNFNPLEQVCTGEFAGERILLVEDNEINAEIAKEILGRTGVTVDHVWDGKEALDILTDSEPNYYDMVFMDIQMPVMDGHEAARAIRSANRDDLKEIPIIAMTANAFAEDVRAALDAGMNQHIAKPLDIAQMMDVLHKWL